MSACCRCRTELEGMTDTLTVRQRSERMSRVRGGNTEPELAVRRLITQHGFRYRLHSRDLAGKPDLVFRRLGKVIFVHGCFWHRHQKKTCSLARLPKSRLEFWLPKLEANRLRDVRNLAVLKQAGWKVLVVWECELRQKEQLENKILRFLERPDESDRTVRRRGRPRDRN